MEENCKEYGKDLQFTGGIDIKDRILIVTPLYPPYTGGAAIHFSGLVQCLKAKLDIVVLTTYHRGPVKPEYNVKMFRTIPNLLESYVPNSAAYKVLRYLILPAMTFISTFFICLRYRPKLIHVHSSTSITSGACLFSLLFRIPVFVDVQDLFPREFPLNRVIKIGCMPRYIALGSEVENILLSIGIPIHRIFTLPPARLSQDIKGIPEGAGDETNITLLFIGGLTKIKGIDILLEAFKLVSSKTESISLKIIGDGPMREFCEDFIDKNNLDIKLLGVFNHERTLKEISSSDIVILASRTEGYPRVILEAFEFGKPVIATNIGGVPQLLKNGENGILVDPCDHAGLAGAILKLCNDKELREKLGKSGKQSLEGMPSFKDLAKKIVEFYGL